MPDSTMISLETVVSLLQAALPASAGPTQATLEQVLAKLSDDPATASAQAQLLAKLSSDPATDARLELARALLASIDGKLHDDSNNGLRAQLSLGYVVPYVASTTDLTATVGAPCDGVKVPTDDYSIAYESADGPDTSPGVNITDTVPTVGAGWTNNGDGTYTHTAGGGTAALTWSNALAIGAKVLSKYTISGRTAGTVTAKAGTAAGAATGADAAVRESLTTAGSRDFTLVPTTDSDATVSLIDVLPVSEKLKAGVFNAIRCSRILAVYDATGAEAATTVLRLGWYRKPTAP